VETKDYIKGIPLFNGLDDSAIDKLSEISHKKSFKKDEVIFNSGDKGSSLFLLATGAVKISLYDDQGKEMILKILYDGDFFGEMSLLDGDFRSASVMAIEPSTAFTIEGYQFYKLISSYPELAMKIMISLSRRLRKLDEKAFSLALADSASKVASMLLELMDEKGSKSEDGILIETNLTRQEMASMVAITRETFTRTLRLFQERGIIIVEGRSIRVKDELALRREAF